MQTSTRLGLSYIQPQQAQKHVTANESFRRLDAVVQLSVKSATSAAQPAAPSDGDCYIIPPQAAGSAWAAFSAGSIAAYQDGAWSPIAPQLGWRAFVEDAAEVLVYAGGWKRQPQLGVNAAADTTNRLAVKSDAILFSHDDVTPGNGDCKIKANKATIGDTASHVFQTNYSGRAEVGLIGNDDFTIKVSPNGASWHQAVKVAKDSGDIGLGAPVDFSLAPGIPQSAVSIGNNNTGRPTLALQAAGNGAPGCRFDLFRAQGSIAGPTAVADGQTIGVFNFFGFDGAAYQQAASFRVVADGAPVAGSECPQRLVFLTGKNSSTLVERMRITPLGDIGLGVTAPVCRLDIDGPARVKSYAKASLPAAGAGAGQIIYVSDEAGGATIAFSDGASWRRVADRVVVS